jgi:NADPH-dependent 7-cyano-7-deazaguanine reductase QueF-like protein
VKRPIIALPNKKYYRLNLRNVLKCPHMIRAKNGFYFRESIRHFQFPCVDAHQERMRDGELHKKLAAIGKEILNQDAETLHQLVIKYTDQHINGMGPYTQENIISFLRPILLKIYYEILFQEEISEEAEAILIKQAENFNNTLKAISIRNRNDRLSAYRYLYEKFKHSKISFIQNSIKFIGIDYFTQHMLALFLNTGTIQVAETCAHTISEISKNTAIHKEFILLINKLSQQPFEQVIQNDKLENYLKETLRLFPLFGITSRTANKDIEIEGHLIKKNTRIFLHFQSLQQQGWDHPEEFDISRWDKNSSTYNQYREARQNCLPFGTGHRRCPAEKFSKILTKSILLRLYQHLDIYIAPHFHHTRYIQHGLPVLMIKKSASISKNEKEKQLAILANRTQKKEIAGYKWLSPLAVIKAIIKNIILQKKVSKENFYPIVSAMQIWWAFVFRRFFKEGTLGKKFHLTDKNNHG